MSEKVLQTKILRHLRSLKQSWWVKFPAGMYGIIGVPDILGCLSGQFYAFEVKFAKGKPTKLQLKTIDLINRAGGRAFVVYSLEEVINAINNV